MFLYSVRVLVFYSLTQTKNYVGRIILNALPYTYIYKVQIYRTAWITSTDLQKPPSKTHSDCNSLEIKDISNPLPTQGKVTLSNP